MPVDILNTTTLSEALTDTTDDFTVGSTANITVGNLLVVRNEAMKVQAIPVSGRVQVQRGWNGTKAFAHPSGHRLFIGAPSSFKAIKDSASALVGDSGTFPEYMLPGQRASDGAGNEYELVELTAVTYSGTTVLISNDGNYTAAVLSATEKGRVGLTIEGGTSDQYTWVQIKGFNSYAQESTDDSAATSAYLAVAASSDSTPDVGLTAVAATSFSSVLGAGQYVIHGMWVVGAATTATTSATSATGVAVPVFLNYPYVTGYTEKTNATS